MDRRTFTIGLGAAAGAPLLAPLGALAQGAWPQQPVRIIVPFAAGGSAAEGASVPHALSATSKMSIRGKIGFFIEVLLFRI